MSNTDPARNQRRKTQRADLPPPPPPPGQHDSNANPLEGSTGQKTIFERNKTSSIPAKSDFDSSPNQNTDNKPKHTPPHRPPPPRKPPGRRSASNSPDLLRSNFQANSPSPRVARKLRGDNADSDDSRESSPRNVGIRSGAYPRPSPRHSLNLENSPEIPAKLSLAKASSIDTQHPVPSPRPNIKMDVDKTSSGASKPAPPPASSKPTTTSAQLKKKFLQEYGDNKYSQGGASNAQSAVARSINAFNNQDGTKKQYGGATSGLTGSGALKFESRSAGLLRDKSTGSAGSGSARQSIYSNSSSNLSPKSKRETVVSDDVRFSQKLDRVVISDFLDQLKGELGTDGSSVGGKSASSASSTNTGTKSVASSRPGVAAPRMDYTKRSQFTATKTEDKKPDIKKIGSKWDKPAIPKNEPKKSALAPSLSTREPGSRLSNEASDSKNELRRLRRKSSDKDKSRKKAPVSKSTFYTDTDSGSTEKGSSILDTERSSIASRTSVKSTGSSKFYITEEREEKVETIKDHKVVVASRLISHKKSTVSATRNMFEKNAVTTVSKKAEELKDELKSDINKRTDKTKDSSDISDKPSSIVPPKRLFGEIKLKPGASKTDDVTLPSKTADSKKKLDELSRSKEDLSPVAPIRIKRLQRKQSSPVSSHQDLKEFIRAESEPKSPTTENQSKPTHITKSTSNQAVSSETKTSSDKSTEDNDSAVSVKTRSNDQKTHRRMKSLLSFTAEDTDIFQRKSTEYLLEDTTTALHETTGNKATTPGSTASNPRVSRRDFLHSLSPSFADKRRSRSLDPQACGVKADGHALGRKPLLAPKPNVKPPPPLQKPVVKKTALPSQTSSPQKVVLRPKHSETEQEVYNDASTAPNKPTTLNVLQSEDNQVRAPSYQYDNNFANAGKEGHLDSAQDSRKSMSLPATSPESLGEAVYEDFDFEADDTKSTLKGDNSCAPQEEAYENVFAAKQEHNNTLNSSKDADASLNDSIHTLVSSTHRNSSDSDSSVGSNYRSHIYSAIDEIRPRNPSNRSDQSEHLYECIDVPPNRRQKHGHTKEEKTHDPTVKRNISRKKSMKLTRKLSRKWTRKYGQSEKFEKLKKVLQEYNDEFADSNEDGEEEELEFSDMDSDFGDYDSFTDDSDIEFENEMLARLSEMDREAISEYGTSPMQMPKTQKIAMELLTTERSYVDKLHLIDQIFHNKIVLENRDCKMFPDEVIPQMFSNVKSIYQFHHDFLLPQLEKRMKEWSSNPRIGDVMCKYAPFLKMYTEYVSNFDNAMETINAWREKLPRFTALLQELQAKPECQMLNLQHHMLCPIQRVPRYELLLKEYLKHLAEDAEDRDEANKALDMVTKAALTSNNIMRSNEKFQKLLEVNDKLGGVLDLVSPTRELIKEGRIIKLSARNGQQQERYIFLFNDMLLLCTPVAVSLKQTHKVSYKLSIDGMTVQEGDNLETPNTFTVKNKQKVLELHCEREDEKMEWQITIWNVISEYLKKKQTRGQGQNLNEEFSSGSEPGKTPPKWIKDQEASQCMICGTPFTMLKRRHHCRGCGKVVCGKCSAYRAKLEYDGGEKPNRVCVKCFTFLEKKGVTEISGPTHVTSPVIRSRRLLQVSPQDGAVQSGYMQMSQDKRTWTRRWFAVRKDYVLYSFKAHQDVVALTSLPLPGYQAAKVEPQRDHIHDREHVIKLWHPSQRKAYFFHVENKDILEKWLSTLEYVVQAELPPDFIEKLPDNALERQNSEAPLKQDDAEPAVKTERESHA